MFLGIPITESDACKLAYKLERTYNPYCGYQDPYGCGVGGFKRIDFFGESSVRYEFLPSTIFDYFDIHLLFTGVTRNSKKILKNVTENLDKIRPLLETSDRAYQTLIDDDYDKFMYLMNESWEQKKRTSSSIAENETIVSMDDNLKEKVKQRFDDENLLYEEMHFDVNRNILNPKYQKVLIIEIGSINKKFEKQIKIISEI